MRVDARAAPLKQALQQQPNVTVATAKHPALRGVPTRSPAMAEVAAKRTGPTTHVLELPGIQALSTVELALALVEHRLLVDEAVKVHQREQLRDLLELPATPTPSLVRQRHTAVAVAAVDGPHRVELVVQAVAEQEAPTMLSALLEPRTLAAAVAVVARAVSQVAQVVQEL